MPGFKYFSYCLLLIVSSFTVVAQTGAVVGSVAGKLEDTRNMPVAFATLTLLRMDSSIAGGDLSKEDGTFLISPIRAGSYVVRVEAIGMATKRIPVTLSADQPKKLLGTIKLETTENKLQEVTVTGEKRMMELKVDKKVFNVEKNTTTSGGSATDVLQNVPSVSVESDGTVSLRGKSGITILIDGKPATMLGSDVATALQSLPASSIESVEVITNPSAKYDAQGTGGIINIITKKDGRFGLNGNLSLGAGTRDKYNGNLGLNVKKGKWNVFMNSSFRLNRTFNNVSTDRLDKFPTDSGITLRYRTYEHVPRIFNGSFNSAGVTFDPDKNNSITFTQNVNVMNFAFKDYSDYHVYNAANNNGGALLHQNRYTSTSGGPFSLSSAIDYKHKFKKKGEELNVDATYATTTIQRSNYYRTEVDIAGVADAGNPVIQNAPGSGSNNSINVWADYTDPLFTTNGKLGMGFKSQVFNFSSSNNAVIYSSTMAERVDSTLLSSYQYNQQIHAAYVNWSDQMGKVSYQLGLRAEDAIYKGSGNVPVAATFSNSFFNFFPSAFLSYQLQEQQSVYLNYSRRTNRPNFYQMMPYRDFSNPSTVSMGNPDIIPEFIHNIEFSYSKADKKGNNYIVSAYFAQTQNLIERVSRQITEQDTAIGLAGEAGKLLVVPLNIASGTTFGLEGIGRLQLTKAWDATVSANMFRNQLVAGGGNAAFAGFLNNNSGYSWFAKMNSNLKLPKNFSLQLNANYESPKVITQGSQQESYWMDLALKKTLLHNKATLVLNCSDVFKTRVFITQNELEMYNQTINRVKETRIGNITFTYRFGKSETGKGGPGAGGRRGGEKPKVEKPTEEDRGKNLKQGDDNDQGGGSGGGAGGGGQRGGR